MDIGGQFENQSGFESARTDAPVPVDETAVEHHSVYCPTCSNRLSSRRCKLICGNCGYYLSCADYY